MHGILNAQMGSRAKKRKKRDERGEIIEEGQINYYK